MERSVIRGRRNTWTGRPRIALRSMRATGIASSEIELRRIAAPAAFVTGYACLVLYFTYVDVYNQHFFDRSYTLAYNIVRIGFGFYLFFLLYTTGNTVLRRIERRGPQPPADGVGARIVTCFFAGAIVWQLLMLALGFASLYYRAIAVAATLPVMLLASFEFLPLVRAMHRALAAKLRGYDARARVVAIILLIFLLGAGLSLAAVKGLYPAGGHDYFTHYFYYYTTSLKNHGIWPNDVWSHYFYSKGQGIFFLGMLLTDPLAPSVVTACFIAVAAVALFLFIDRMMPGTMWPWAAVACWLLVLAGAGGEEDFAEFAKGHEINAAFVIVFVWLCDGMLRSTGSGRSPGLWLAASCAVAGAFTEQPMPILLGLVTAGIAAALLLLRRWRQSLEFMLLAGACGAGLLCNLGLNYLTTGIANDLMINALWRIADLRKLELLGWLFPVVKRSRDLSAPLGQHWGDMRFLKDNARSFLHLDFMQPWFGYAPGAALSIGAAVMLIAYRRRLPSAMHSCALTIVMIFAAFCVFASTVAARAPASFSRYASFMLPVELAAGAMVWMLVADGSGVGWIRRLVSAALPAVATVLMLGHIWHSDRAAYQVAAHDATRFVSGRMSNYAAYKAESVWPFRDPWGAIYPGSLAVWKVVGRGVRVWTFHVNAYCMLPDCRWELQGPFTMSPHMLDVLFAAPERARDILRSEGLNYFLISRELEIHGVQAAAGLFSPGCIGRYLGVKWTDGTTYLLTWLGPGVEPLAADWLEAYRRQAAESESVRQFPEQQLRLVYDRLKADPAWGKDLPLPWLE